MVIAETATPTLLAEFNLDSGANNLARLPRETGGDFDSGILPAAWELAPEWTAMFNKYAKSD